MDFGGFFRDRRLYERPAAVRAYRGLRSLTSRAGLHVVLKTFYSPIPELDRLPPGWFDRRSQLPGMDLGLDRQAMLLRERLAGPAAEFDPPAIRGEDPHRYAIENPSYSHLDATILYAMLRAYRPRRVIELGSGQSTLVSADALRRNAADGSPARLEVYDPYAARETDTLPEVAALHRMPAQDIAPAVFEELDDGDVLFVDTTHTVKMGSDVNFIVLEVLPRLAAGVIVHVHDIFLPYEYPRGFAEEYGLYWSEQYLLQAFLSMNAGYEVVFAVAAMTHERREALRALLPNGAGEGWGSAFWIRRTSA